MMSCIYDEIFLWLLFAKELYSLSEDPKLTGKSEAVEVGSGKKIEVMFNG